MNPSTTQGEFETDTGELESDTFEFEANDEFEFEAELESPLAEVEEMELATELLAISNEEELDQFLGKLFKRVGRGLRKFGRVVRPLGGLLKGIAKKALPFVGGALGSFIPIPGVGTAVGSALGSAASKLLEVDLEGMEAEDQEFELARRFVRMASAAAAQAAATPADIDPKAAAIRAVKAAAQQLGQGEVDGEVPSRRALSGGPGASGPRRRGRAGRWYRRGNAIVLVGA